VTFDFFLTGTTAFQGEVRTRRCLFVKQKQKTKAIRIKENEKVTRIEPAAKNVKAEVTPTPKGGISLSMELAIDEELDD